MSGVGTVTLAVFVLARVAEDESHMRYMAAHAASRRTIGEIALAHTHSSRVLAECEAKRRIVGALDDAAAATRTVGSDPTAPGDWQEWGNYHAWLDAAKIIAAPYADHPDYRDEWRP